MSQNLQKRTTLLKFDSETLNESKLSLNRYLVDFSNLSLITKQAHWNLQGLNFIAVQEMLDDFYQTLQKYVDIFAERLVQLNFIAVGTSEHLAQNTSFEEYPFNISSVTDHLRELHIRYASVANSMREDINLAKADAATIDYYTQAVEDLDKFIWFIEAHLN